MYSPGPPFPPGFQPPGIGYFLLIGGIVIFFTAAVLSVVGTAPTTNKTDKRERTNKNR
jgi:hypothetical protein